MWTAKFWKRTVERAIKTGLQAYIAAWAVLGHEFDEITNVDSLEVAGAAVFLSIVTSMVSAIPGDSENPSAID